MPLPWGDPLAREPFDRYKETERQRTGNFISSIVSRAQTRSLERISGIQPMMRTPPKKKKNFLDRTISTIDKVTPEFSEDIGKGALKAISAPQEYVGKPLFALTSGQLGARQQTGENGQTYRDFDPSWSDFGRGIKKLATQDPRDTYNEARQAFDEARADPNKSRWKGAAADALSDPLTYVPIGGVTKLGAKAPLALKAGKVGKVGRGAAAVLETAPRTAAYGVAGSSLGAELAPKVGLPEWVGTVGGGIGGGILSVKAPRTPRMDLNANVVADAAPPPASQADNFGLDALGKPLPRKAAKAMTMEPTREDLMKWLLEEPGTTAKDAAFLTNAAEIDATRDAYFRDALKRNKALRETGDLKTPYRENIERVGLDAENIARGKKALLARVSSEASKKEITPDMAESARWFIKELPDKYLDRLGSSYVKRGEGALAGQYVAKDADAMNSRTAAELANRMSIAQLQEAGESSRNAARIAADLQMNSLNNQTQRYGIDTNAAVAREDLAGRERIATGDRTSRETIAEKDRQESARQFDLNLGEDRRQFNATMLFELFGMGVELMKNPVDWLAYQYYLENLAIPMTAINSATVASGLGAVPPTGPSELGPMVGGPAIIDGDFAAAEAAGVQPGFVALSQALQQNPGQPSEWSAGSTAGEAAQRWGDIGSIDAQLTQSRAAAAAETMDPSNPVVQQVQNQAFALGPTPSRSGNAATAANLPPLGNQPAPTTNAIYSGEQTNQPMEELIRGLAGQLGMNEADLWKMSGAGNMTPAYSKDAIANAPVMQAIRSGAKQMSQFRSAPVSAGATASPSAQLTGPGLGLRGGQDLNAGLLINNTSGNKGMIQGAVMADGHDWDTFAQQSLKASPITAYDTGVFGRRR